MNWITNARIKALKRIAQQRLNIIRSQNAQLDTHRRHIKEQGKAIGALQTENANIRQRYAKGQEDLTIVLAEKAAVQRDLDNTEAALRGCRIQLNRANAERSALVREIDEARRKANLSATAARPQMAIYPPEVAR